MTICAFWLIPGCLPFPSPASRLSRVFFQIASSALAVESLMWSLKDLRSGPLRGRAITWPSGSPIYPRVTSGGSPGPSFFPGRSGRRHCGWRCGLGTRLQAASWRVAQRAPRRPHLERLSRASGSRARYRDAPGVTQSPRSLCGAASGRREPSRSFPEMEQRAEQVALSSRFLLISSAFDLLDSRF